METIFKKYPENFIKSLEETLKFEGLYSFDPDDPGGETYCGISRKNFPRWDGWHSIDYLKHKINLETQEVPELEEKVADFYYQNFWTPLSLDKIQSFKKAKVLFDAGVNMGLHNTKKLAQKVLKVTPDGIIGPITIKALNEIDEDYFVAEFKLKRIEYYINLTKRKPVFRKYIVGWVSRVLNN